MTGLRTTIFSLIAAPALALTALPAGASDSNAGAYLAARQASIGSDFAAAARYYAEALVLDPRNIDLLEGATTSQVALGQIDRALPTAKRLSDISPRSQLANLVLHATNAKAENWGAVLDALDAGQTVGPLFDGLLEAWALVGEGRMGAALARFDVTAESRGVQAFGLYHKALALASVGDFEGAARILDGQDGVQINLTRRGVIAHAQILSQLDRRQDAIDLLDARFQANSDPQVTALRARLEAGLPVTYDTVISAVEGAAELHHSIALVLSGEASAAYTLIYSRMTGYLKPDHTDGLLLTAALLEDMGRFELATTVYDQIPQSDPLFASAELGRAEALRLSGNEEAAIEVLRQLGKSNPDLMTVHITLGDMFRQMERFEEAVAPYDRAIALIDTLEERHWRLYFVRGIAYERIDRWEEAEADFRQALDLRPDQPQVLNYLGYSFVEMKTNLDEALDMIERAVAGDPDSGYITDSLGWVLYRLGRYDEAVGHMERAVELEPIDPIINDHLGDVYWAVGRTREAEFQWHRALSFDPEPEEAERIRRKLEIGLDAVLAEEGAPPLQVANDEG